LAEILFNILHGFIITVVIIAIPLVSPGSFNDFATIGQRFMSLYIVIFAIKILFGLYDSDIKSEVESPTGQESEPQLPDDEVVETDETVNSQIWH
jgi:hypothetical protein